MESCDSANTSVRHRTFIRAVGSRRDPRRIITLVVLSISIDLCPAMARVSVNAHCYQIDAKCVVHLVTKILTLSEALLVTLTVMCVQVVRFHIKISEMTLPFLWVSEWAGSWRYRH